MTAFDVRPLAWDGAVLRVLDQRALPVEERWVECPDAASVAAAIRSMTVRGAPLIGVVAAYGVALAARHGSLEEVEAAAAELRAARPTAVDLPWAVDRMLEVARSGAGAAAVVAAAAELERADVAACREIGRTGLALIPGGGTGGTVQVATHCNAGALATCGYGTALGVVRAAVEAGRDVHVWVGETRPVLQGARLTAWELTRAGIPNTLQVDAAAPSLIASGGVDVVVVGADRIAANGDVANKIGTYGLALAARESGVPFVVAAPTSTVDMECPRGAAIRIEERDAGEVVLEGRVVAGQRVRNPAFDVTPAALVTAIVTEKGVVRPVGADSVSAVAARRA